MLDIIEKETEALEKSLYVEKSVKGQRWVSHPVDERLALTISQKLSVPMIVAELLVRRGISYEQAASFLTPKLKDYMPDPYVLKDMEKAVKRLSQAIENKEKILIFGDYDVDGATSSATLINFLKAIGVTADLYIPDRMIDGYGPNERAFQKFIDDGVQLVITVDCGTMSFEPIALAAENKMDVIVIDHHKADTKLPNAHAVVNPNRVDEPISDLQFCAAVGVVYLFIIGINRYLREEGFYEKNKIAPPNMLSFLDLVALGTVCDVVPLKGLNRAYVTQGLKIMAQRQNPGLVTLSDIAGLNEKPAPYHCGFVIGPRINAGGRVGESYLGSRLLSHQGGVEAEKMSKALDAYNKERKEIEVQILEESIEAVETQGLHKKPIILVSGQGWHPGVIGIVASRLKDKYWRPTCVIGIDEKGIGKASGRSISGLDLGNHVLAANHEGLLINGGGHAMAVGFTIEASKLPDYERFLIDRIQAEFPEGLPKRESKIDGILSVGGVQLDLIEDLEKIGPYGMGNAEPQFVLNNVQIVKADVVGQDHLRCIIRGAGGDKNGMASLTAMSFRSVQTTLGDFLRNAVGGPSIKLLGKIKINDFRGSRTPQMIIEDAAV